MIDHLGDDAELYPLGVLDVEAARHVERHIAGCNDCAARVAGAQRAAASLASALPVVAPSPSLGRRLSTAVRRSAAPRRARAADWRLLGMAAAFVVTLGGLAWQTSNLQRQTAAQNLALATIVHSHLRHVPMTSDRPPPFGAKVLYALDDSWIYIVVDRPGGRLEAVARTATGEANLGTLESSGETASLLVHSKERIQTVELRDAGTTIARATLI